MGSLLDSPLITGKEKVKGRVLEGAGWEAPCATREGDGSPGKQRPRGWTAKDEESELSVDKAIESRVAIISHMRL